MKIDENEFILLSRFFEHENNNEDFMIMKHDFFKVLQMKTLQASLKPREKYPGLLDPKFELLRIKDLHAKNVIETQKRNLFQQESQCIFDKKVKKSAVKKEPEFIHKYEKFLEKYKKTNRDEESEKHEENQSENEYLYNKKINWFFLKNIDFFEFFIFFMQEKSLNNRNHPPFH